MLYSRAFPGKRGILFQCSCDIVAHIVVSEILTRYRDTGDHKSYVLATTSNPADTETTYFTTETVMFLHNAIRDAA